MDEAALIALVGKAISLYKTTGCLEYINEELQRRVRRELSDVGTPAHIKYLLVTYSAGGGRIVFRHEGRDERQDRREFWFKARVPISGFSGPLFYELELTDDDKDCPAVAILNVHW